MSLAYAGLRAWAVGGTGISGATPGLLGVFLIKRFPNGSSYAMRAFGPFSPWHLHLYRLMPTISPLWSYGAGLLLLAVFLRTGKPAWAAFCFLWAVVSFIPKIP